MTAPPFGYPTASVPPLSPSVQRPSGNSLALQYFTLVHIVISLVGIAAGYGVLSGLLAAKLLPRWTAVFLAFTAATSVTGFFFPFHGFTPALAVGVVSLVPLAVAGLALYIRRLGGGWRTAFVVGTLAALYLDSFVLVAQTFQKNPALVEIAPDQNAPPFAVTQAALLVAFVVLGTLAVRRFRSGLSRPS